MCIYIWCIIIIMRAKTHSTVMLMPIPYRTWSSMTAGWHFYVSECVAGLDSRLHTPPCLWCMMFWTQMVQCWNHVRYVSHNIVINPWIDTHINKYINKIIYIYIMYIYKIKIYTFIPLFLNAQHINHVCCLLHVSWGEAPSSMVLCFIHIF